MTLRFDAQSCAKDPDALRLVLNMLAEDFVHLRSSYPEFEYWLLHKVIPGLLHGERSIFIEQRNSVVAGIVILKHTADEKKICTLRVRPEYECLGLGVRLFEKSFEVLETERPLLSVSENAYPKFSRLFDHFDFSHRASYAGMYLPRISELSFNGVLEDDTRRPPPLASSPIQNRVQRQRANRFVKHNLLRGEFV